MGLFSSAQNALDVASATVSALQIFERLSRSSRHKESLVVIRAVVIALIEGYQGKLRGRQISDALVVLGSDLERADGEPSAAMADSFRGAL